MFSVSLSDRHSISGKSTCRRARSRVSPLFPFSAPEMERATTLCNPLKNDRTAPYVTPSVRRNDITIFSPRNSSNCSGENDAASIREIQIVMQKASHCNEAINDCAKNVVLVFIVHVVINLLAFLAVRFFRRHGSNNNALLNKTM